MGVASYGETRLKATKLTKPVVVWEDEKSGVTWALRLICMSTKVAPQLRHHSWRCLGVLPPGTPMEDLGDQREEDFALRQVAGAEVHDSP